MPQFCLDWRTAWLSGVQRTDYYNHPGSFDVEDRGAAERATDLSTHDLPCRPAPAPRRGGGRRRYRRTLGLEAGRPAGSSLEEGRVGESDRRVPRGGI